MKLTVTDLWPHLVPDPLIRVTICFETKCMTYSEEKAGRGARAGFLAHPFYIHTYSEERGGARAHTEN
jgi:hypothetical protein